MTPWTEEGARSSHMSADILSQTMLSSRCTVSSGLSAHLLSSLNLPFHSQPATQPHLHIAFCPTGGPCHSPAYKRRLDMGLEGQPASLCTRG
uniref:Uncharacterized protein n=1 Tax=Knipowitschia caucasica TaxID=637954 RepID=A0AAV2LWK2_KNICA